MANHMKYLMIESQFIKNLVFDLAKAKSFYVRKSLYFRINLLRKKL